MYPRGQIQSLHDTTHSPNSYHKIKILTFLLITFMFFFFFFFNAKLTLDFFFFFFNCNLKFDIFVFFTLNLY